MRTLRLFLISAILVLFLPILTFSQEGPMGIGNKDGTPTSAGPQPKLLLWLDGSSARGLDTNGEPTLYQNNMSVDVWLDKSGNGFHFYLSDEGNYNPVLMTVGGPDATPSLEFRNPNLPNFSKHFVCENFSLPEDGYTIYFVIKSNQDKYGIFSYASPT